MPRKKKTDPFAHLGPPIDIDKKLDALDGRPIFEGEGVEERAEFMIKKYKALDADLVKKGFPPTSPWWMNVIEKFYRSGKIFLTLRVGRRGGKSSTLSRLAVVEALYGGHKVTPGDIGWVMVISVDRDEAAQRIRMIAKILNTLGYGRPNVQSSAEEIVVHDLGVGFKMFTASVGGVSGKTAIMVICDEVAKWRDASGLANPANEVIASVKPCMGTMEYAKMVLSSSPFGKTDAHARAFDEGDTRDQMIAFARTWESNPTLSEERTHALAKNEREWLREWACIPQADQTAAFDPSELERSFRKPPQEKEVEGALRSEPVMVIDAASGGPDRFTFGIVYWIYIKPKIGYREVSTEELVPKLFFEHVEAFPSQFTGPQIVRKIIEECRRRRIRFVFGDQRDAYQIKGQLDEAGIGSNFTAWGTKNKIDAVNRLRAWFHDDLISLPMHSELRLELLKFNEVITPSGSISYKGRGMTHDDYVALLLTAAIADSQGMLGGSPYGFKTSPFRDLGRLAYL